jgi:hypothetical protein
MNYVNHPQSRVATTGYHYQKARKEKCAGRENKASGAM